jgi:hypothetical protein
MLSQAADGLSINGNQILKKPMTAANFSPDVMWRKRQLSSTDYPKNVDDGFPGSKT